MRRLSRTPPSSTSILVFSPSQLLYCAGGFESLCAELATAPPLASDCHMQNIEAYATGDACDAPFRSGGVRAFRHDQRSFCAYMNGKAFGRVSAPRLRSLGPHGFYCDGAGERHHVPPWLGCVLHYESISLAAWRRKFGDLAATHAAEYEERGGGREEEEEGGGKLPRYYRESVLAMAAVRRARDAGDAISLQIAEQAANALWRRWKMPPAHASDAAALERLHATGEPQILPEGVTLLKLEPAAPEPAAPERASCARASREPAAGGAVPPTPPMQASEERAADVAAACGVRPLRRDAVACHACSARNRVSSGWRVRLASTVTVSEV